MKRKRVLKNRSVSEGEEETWLLLEQCPPEGGDDAVSYWGSAYVYFKKYEVAKKWAADVVAHKGPDFRAICVRSVRASNGRGDGAYVHLGQAIGKRWVARSTGEGLLWADVVHTVDGVPCFIELRGKLQVVAVAQVHDTKEAALLHMETIRAQELAELDVEIQKLQQARVQLAALMF